MLNSILITVLRGIIAYALALFLSRLMGRKLISQMTFFDFVVGVTMGTLAASLATGPKTTTAISITALIVLSVLAISTSLVNLKSLKFRKASDSEPIVLMDNGNIVDGNMKRSRLTLEELTMKLREKNIFNLADVEFAIMETDGQLSVLPKADKAPITPSDMNIKTNSTGLMRDVIIDGNIMNENLNAVGLNARWLEDQLKKKGIDDVSEVFYGGLDKQKTLYISKRNAYKKETEGQYGIE